MRKVDKTIRDEKMMGIELEKKVEAWAKKRFRPSKTTVRLQASGLSVKRPYDVDVWVCIPRGWFKDEIDLWIECKDRSASIKRKDISELISKAKDVFEAAKAGRQDLWFNRLMFVATSRYDYDAIALAVQEGVACIYYDGKAYSLQSDWDWDEKPKWLRDVEATG
jgi:hypothetical protein